MVRSFGYHSDFSMCWWLVPGFDMEYGLRPLSGDNDCIELMNICFGKEEVHFFVEHPLDDPTIVEDGADTSSSESVQVQDVKGKGKVVDEGNDCVEAEAEDSESDGDIDINMFESENEEGQGSRAADNQYSSEGENDSWVSEELGELVCSDPEDVRPRKKYATYHPAPFGRVFLQLGMEFPSLGVFKRAVKDYSMQIGRTYRYVKNDKTRVRAECLEENCDWLIYCSWSPETNSYQVKSFQEGHSCAMRFNNKQANCEWVAEQMVPEIRAHPRMTKDEAFEFLKTQRNVHVKDGKLFRALRAARKTVEGSERKQYANLKKYIKVLKERNKGSTVALGTRGNTFDRLYICLAACKQGFKEGCRPLIGLDGCFLKGYYGGQLLSAVAMDGNNAFFVIAYAIVESESKDTWSWFLQLLLGDIGDYKEHGYNFITDQQKVSYVLVLFL